MSAMPGSAVETLLHRAGRWLALAAAAQAAAIALTILLLAGVALVILDAVLALPPAGLIAGDFFLVTLLLASVAYVVRHAWGRSRNPLWPTRACSKSGWRCATAR